MTIESEKLKTKNKKQKNFRNYNLNQHRKGSVKDDASRQLNSI